MGGRRRLRNTRCTMLTISTISIINTEGPCFVPSSYTPKCCQIPNHCFRLPGNLRPSDLHALLALVFCVASFFPHCHFSNPEILFHARKKEWQHVRILTLCKQVQIPMISSVRTCWGSTIFAASHLSTNYHGTGEVCSTRVFHWCIIYGMINSHSSQSHIPENFSLISCLQKNKWMYEISILYMLVPECLSPSLTSGPDDGFSRNFVRTQCR